eukprot:3801953-Alexandrium_andersonii.AAC.1
MIRWGTQLARVSDLLAFHRQQGAALPRGPFRPHRLRRHWPFGCACRARRADRADPADHVGRA